MTITSKMPITLFAKRSISAETIAQELKFSLLKLDNYLSPESNPNKKYTNHIFLSMDVNSETE